MKVFFLVQNNVDTAYLIDELKSTQLHVVVFSFYGTKSNITTSVASCDILKF